MTEDTFFLRKIRWESLTYYRDLPASTSSTNDRQHQPQPQPKELREAQEIQALFAYGPVQASLNLVQRWWLFVHRSELREILRTGRASIIHRDENVSDPTTALREYWQRYCIPIVENVLYFNRSRDEWHTPLDRLDELKQDEAAETAAAAEEREKARGKRPRLDMAVSTEGGDNGGSGGNGNGSDSGEENGGRTADDGDVAEDDADDGDEPTDAKRARR